MLAGALQEPCSRHYGLFIIVNGTKIICDICGYECIATFLENKERLIVDRRGEKQTFSGKVCHKICFATLNFLTLHISSLNFTVVMAEPADTLAPITECVD